MTKADIHQLTMKIPPQAIEVERAVLGIILLEAPALDVALEILKEESFYSEFHKNVFKACRQLSQRSQNVDLLTVTEQMRRDETMPKEGPFEIMKLTNGVVSSANFENYCRIIQEKYILREMIFMGSDLIGKGYEDSIDVFDLIEQHEKKLTDLISNTSRSSYTNIGDDLARAVVRLAELRTMPSHITGVPSGFPEIDKITHGWQNTDLIILAARPAVGKTAFMLNLARNAARAGYAVGRFSLEMSTAQLTNRDLSAESGIFLDNLLTGRLDNEQMGTVSNVAGKISDWKIYTDDTGALNIFELRAKARRMKRKHDVKIIFIDYLQLMSGVDAKGNREQEISKISRDLKGLAKEMKIPIIALSQLSRQTETRKGDARVPQLSDLRESGAIEQDADMVMFLYRPEYYDANAAQEGEVEKGETHLKIAKHRNGTLETVKLRAQLHIQKFSQLQTGEGYKPVESKPDFKSVAANDKDSDLPF